MHQPAEWPSEILTYKKPSKLPIILFVLFLLIITAGFSYIFTSNALQSCELQPKECQIK